MDRCVKQYLRVSTTKVPDPCPVNAVMSHKRLRTQSFSSRLLVCVVHTYYDEHIFSLQFLPALLEGVLATVLYTERRKEMEVVRIHSLSDTISQF